MAWRLMLSEITDSIEVNIMTLMGNFSKNLKRIHTDRGKTVEQFAKILGIGKSTLQNFEAERGNPTLATICVIERNLNLSEGEILSKPGDKGLPEIDYNRAFLCSIIDLASKPEEFDKAVMHAKELSLLLSNKHENK